MTCLESIRVFFIHVSETKWSTSYRGDYSWTDSSGVSTHTWNTHMKHDGVSVHRRSGAQQGGFYWITADSSSVITTWISEQVFKGQFTQTTTMTFPLHRCEATKTDLLLFAQNLRHLSVRFLLQLRSNEMNWRFEKKAQYTTITKGAFIRWCKEVLNIKKIPKHNKKLIRKFSESPFIEQTGSCPV